MGSILKKLAKRRARRMEYDNEFFNLINYINKYMTQSKTPEENCSQFVTDINEIITVKDVPKDEPLINDFHNSSDIIDVEAEEFINQDTTKNCSISSISQSNIDNGSISSIDNKDGSLQI